MTTTRPTLLVVDDEAEVLHSVHALLRLNYRVLTCESGAEALALLRSDEPVQVIMSDQRMPRMSGVELLGHARAIRPEVTRLLFTAHADLKAVIDAINKGSVFRYIAKPWDPDEFQTVVRQAVEQHELITERARLIGQLEESHRRLVESDRLKSAFIEVASHELNTPVAVVLGMADLWRYTQGPAATPEEREWVERIYHAGKRLALTVERMLKLARTDDFSRSLDVKPTALAALVERVVSDGRTFIDARGQTVELALHADLGEAEVDASKVSDALTNLLINAIKFSPDGATLRVSGGPDGPDHVRIAVDDQGAGIDVAARALVFEPFFTGFDTMHHSSGEFEFNKRGLGLGLTLVKRFVELHGGTVEVVSRTGGGSTFVVRLPRRQDRPPDPNSNPTRAD